MQLAMSPTSPSTFFIYSYILLLSLRHYLGGSDARIHQALEELEDRWSEADQACLRLCVCHTMHDRGVALNQGLSQLYKIQSELRVLIRVGHCEALSRGALQNLQHVW